MIKTLAILLAVVLLTLPVAGHASAMSSPSYTSRWSAVSSGGGIATSPDFTAKPGIVRGGVAIVPGTSSPGYSVYPEISAMGGSLPGLTHSGDIYGDGVVDIIDVLLALQAGVGLVQLTNTEVSRGDIAPLVNGLSVGDGRIDIEDAILVLRMAVGLSW